MEFLRVPFFGFVILLSAAEGIVPVNGSIQPERAVPEAESAGDRGVVLLLSLSGLNAEYLDSFALPNLVHLRSHSSRPLSFRPEYPGTGTPNLFSMVTGVYPEVHGVLGPTLYDPSNDRVYNSRDREMYTQNPDVVPLWTLNEEQGGVSACIMWPGCEVPFQGRLPTYSVPYNSSTSFTDIVDLVVAFATAKFSKEQYRQFVLRDVPHMHDSELYEPLESEVEGPRTAGDTANTWSLHHLNPNTRHWYSSEREEKYEIVSIETERNNLNGIKQIIDSTGGALKEHPVMGKMLEHMSSHNNASENSGLLDLYDTRHFSPLSEESVVYTLDAQARANFIVLRSDELQKTAETFGPNSLEMKKALQKIDSGLLYLHLLIQQRGIHHKVDLILVSDHCSVPFGGPSTSPSSNDLIQAAILPGAQTGNESEVASSIHEEGRDTDQELASDRIIDLSTMLKNENVFIIGETPVMQIWPSQGANEERIFQALMSASQTHRFNVVRKHKLQPWHFSKNDRIANVLVEAQTGYAFLDKRGLQAVSSLTCDVSQTPVMLVAGPAFLEGVTVDQLQVVDVYAMVTRLLKLQVPLTNSSSADVEAFFQVAPMLHENRTLLGVAVFALFVTLALCLMFVRLYQKTNYQIYEPNFATAVYRSTVESTINISPLRWTGTSDVVFVKQPDQHQENLTEGLPAYRTGLDERDGDSGQSRLETMMEVRGSGTRQSTRSSLDRSEIEQSETVFLLGKNHRSDQVSEI